MRTAVSGPEFSAGRPIRAADTGRRGTYTNIPL